MMYRLRRHQILKSLLFTEMHSIFDARQRCHKQVILMVEECLVTFIPPILDKRDAECFVPDSVYLML